MPQLTRGKKIILGIVFFVLSIWILSALGILKLSFTVNKNNRSNQSSEITNQPESTNKPSQQAKLSSRPVTFRASKSQTSFSLKLPIGWQTGNNSQVDFIAGSLTAQKLPNGQTFTPNINATVDAHQPIVATFVDYQTKWKDILLSQYPSMDFVRDFSTQVDGMDVYVIEVKNTRPDGLVLHQVQYLFYVSDQYAMMMTGTAPDDFWDQYSDIINQSFASVQKLPE